MTTPRILLSDVVAATAAETGLAPALLRSAVRTPKVAKARFAGWEAAQRLTAARRTRLGAMFNRSSHTVYDARWAARRYLGEDPAFAGLVARIEARARRIAETRFRECLALAARCGRRAEPELAASGEAAP